MSETTSRSGTHDYVIVGAGSAGAVLAARLTEDPGLTVLLADYDSWRDEYGAAGWGYDDVLPYFVRADAKTDNQLTQIVTMLHGRGSTLQT